MELKNILSTAVAICAMISSIELRAQTDSVFWFAAPEVTRSSANWDRPIVFRITAYGEPANVVIDQPANASFPDTLVQVPASGTFTFDLTPWIDSIENKPADAVLNYGLRLLSDAPVTVYYEVVSAQCDCQTEIFALKGQTALGPDFWIPSQNLVGNNQAFLPITNSSFDIVATENGTTVTITPSRPLVGHPADSTFTIVLDAGQTFSAMAAGGLPGDHLNGSRVTSTAPIAITVKDDSMRSTLFGTCTDLGGDQIVPVGVLGTEYIAIDGFLNGPGDQLFVMAVEDSTIVFQNEFETVTISAGETIQLDVSD